MRRLVTFIGIVLLVAASFGCWRNPPSPNEQANANTAVESPFASITDANAALAEGNRLLDENDAEMAVAAFQQGVKLDPDLAEAWFQMGIAYSLLETQMARSGESVDTATNSKEARVKRNSEKAFEKAFEAYKRLIAANPNDDVAQFNLGRTYTKLLKDEAAETAFRQAVKLKPDDSEYLTELGAILIRLAKYHEAIEPLRKAVALDESNMRAQDLLEDAEAGRQRLDYVAPKNTNANSTNSNVTANTATNANSSSNSAPRPTNANAKPKKDDAKTTSEPGKKPKDAER